MAVPLLFEPHMCNGQPYVDGALHELAPTSVCPTARQLVVHFTHKRRDLPPTMSGALHLILNSLGVLHVGRAALLPIDVGDVALTSLPTILRQRNVSALINEFRGEGSDGGSRSRNSARRRHPRGRFSVRMKRISACTSASSQAVSYRHSPSTSDARHCFTTPSKGQTETA